jgi:hypothetical protein
MTEAISNIKQATHKLRIKKIRQVNFAMALAVFVLFAFVFMSHSKSAQAACTALPTTYGDATQTINIPSDGTYRVWSRIMAPDTTNNSYYLEIDGTTCGVVVGDSAITANTWTWVDYQAGTSTNKINVTLTAGTHTVRLLGKEQDVEVDRVILTTDTTCVPTGTGDNCAGTTDTTAPTVSVTSPTAGTTVSGSSVALSANATDNVGVVGVQFKVDGANVGAEDTTSPYSVTWNSTSVSDGNHTVTAVARDAAGNTTTSSSVSVTVNNASPGSITMGQTTILANDDSGNGNLLLAQSATLSQSAVLQSMSFYVTTAAGNLRLAVYDATGPSGGPGAKVAETSEITTTTGWDTAPTTTHPTLSAGTYWLAYLPSSNSLGMKVASSGSEKHYGFTYGVMPNTFSTTPTSGTANWSLYASLSSGAPAAKQGDINGDNAVNITDLSLLLSSYGQTTTQCITNTAFKCDLSSPADGIVNIFDLSILLSGYGK